MGSRGYARSLQFLGCSARLAMKYEEPQLWSIAHNVVTTI